MAYGSNQRRSRAALQSLRYLSRTYPIEAFPINATPADVYSGYGEVYPMKKNSRPKSRARYGSSEEDKGVVDPLTMFLVSTGAGLLGKLGGVFSNHVLAEDAAAANAAIANNQLQLEAAKEANKPYLYMAGAFVIGAVALGTAAIFRG